MMVTRETLSSYVDNGCTLLDEKKPGWQIQVDLDRLSMSSWHNCVLGQLYGNLLAGLQGLDVQVSDVTGSASFQWERVCVLGFGLPDDGPMTAEYSTLTEIWKTKIQQRKEQSPTYASQQP